MPSTTSSTSKPTQACPRVSQLLPGFEGPFHTPAAAERDGGALVRLKDACAGFQSDIGLSGDVLLADLLAIKSQVAAKLHSPPRSPKGVRKPAPLQLSRSPLGA